MTSCYFLCQISVVYFFLRLPHLEILIEHLQASPPRDFYAFHFIIFLATYGIFTFSFQSVPRFRYLPSLSQFCAVLIF